MTRNYQSRWRKGLRDQTERRERNLASYGPGGKLLHFGECHLGPAEAVCGWEGQYAYKQFLGYRKGADGLLEIDSEQAEVVRKIYRLFMAGKSLGHIARQLEAEGIPTPGGKTKWQPRVLESILTNE